MKWSIIALEQVSLTAFSFATVSSISGSSPAKSTVSSSAAILLDDFLEPFFTSSSIRLVRTGMSDLLNCLVNAVLTLVSTDA